MQTINLVSTQVSQYYPLFFKIGYFILILPTFFVIVSAFISTKQLGGALGQGLKKIAVGSIVDTVLLMTFILLEKGSRGMLNETQVRLFFITGALFGSSFLIAGYIQVYKISKKLKLFTP